MTPLLRRQLEFARKMALLEGWMLDQGYAWKNGRGLCCENCSKDTSLHRISLARDILLIADLDSDGETDDYVKDTEAYRAIGEKWESMGGSWGGRFKTPDGNHFSLAWEGFR